MKKILPKHCESCGTTLKYVMEVGRLGCGKCYDTFRITLMRLVPQLKQSHVGKKPKGKHESFVPNETRLRG